MLENCGRRSSGRGRSDRGCVARPKRWSLNWLLSRVSPTQTGSRPLHLASKSLSRNILPISPLSAIFCEEKFCPSLCFQYFAGMGGRGGDLQRLRRKSHGLTRLGRDLCRPYGTRSYSSPYPALKRWAKLFRAYGARFRGVCSTYRVGQRVATQSLKPHRHGFPFHIRYSASNSMALLVPLVLLFMTLQVMTQQAVAQPMLSPPQAITDPTKLESKNVADMQTFSIEKLYMTRAIGESTWSPDGKQIAFISNISGRNNLWLVPATGGWPTQLTISDQRQTQPAWSPDGTWIAFISDHDGDEQWDVFLVSPKDRRRSEPDNFAGERGRRACVVARRPADRLHHQAQDRIEF